MIKINFLHVEKKKEQDKKKFKIFETGCIQIEIHSLFLVPRA